MARDCAEELREFNVAFVSLYPGPVRTEVVLAALDDMKGKEELTKQQRQVRKY